MKQYSDYKSISANIFDGTHLKWKLQACLGDKKQKSMFLVVSRLDVHFDFEHPRFACSDERASKVARPKSLTPRNKFAHPWYSIATENNIFFL